MRRFVWFSLCFFVTTALSEEIKGSACVPDSGNPVQDEMMARALAKGQLAHELGSVVNARTELKTITIENGHNVGSTDVVTEHVELSSRHQVQGVRTTSTEYRVQNGKSSYCVTVTLKK